MPRRKSNDDSPKIYKLPPMLSEEQMENFLISEAYQLAYQRLKDGTASSQEVCHFLKLGTTKSRLELGIMSQQKELMAAKTEAINQAEDYRKIASEAMLAMKEYRGGNDDIE